jgi:hypothetical protein
MEQKQYSIAGLRDEYLYSELIRILTSTAAALRILFDQYQQDLAEVRQRPCGELFPDWPTTQQPEVLTLREACNKIIHATKVHYDEDDPDPVHNPDQIGLYLRPYVHLYGAWGGHDWKAVLSIIDFAKLAVSAFARV